MDIKDPFKLFNRNKVFKPLHDKNERKTLSHMHFNIR